VSFSDPVHIVLHLAAFSFLVSLAISGFMISAGLLDSPIERSNHSRQIPTAGGVGIVAGCGAALLALTLFYPSFGDQGLLGAISSLVLGTAFLGILDDIYEVKTSIKFLVMTVIVVAAVSIVGPPTSLPFSTFNLVLPYSLGVAGAALWVFVVMNGNNFMDGCNGLMSGAMSIAFIFLAFVAHEASAGSTMVFAAIMAAALAGFLPYNWRRNAQLFSGDVGALTVGFCFAICVLFLVSESEDNSLIYLGPILIMPFLTDILITMLMRVRRKENLLAAHSSHLYQRMLRGGHAHTAVAFYYSLAAFFCGLYAVVGLKTELIRSAYFLLLLVSVGVLIYLILSGKFASANDPRQMRPDP